MLVVVCIYEMVPRENFFLAVFADWKENRCVLGKTSIEKKRFLLGIARM